MSMRTSLSKFLVFTLFFVAIFAGYTNTASAHTTEVNTVSNFSKTPCDHLNVTLNGQESPIVNCLDTKYKQMAPNIQIENCPNGTLELFWDGGNQGPNICFSGEGTTNLDQFCAPWNYGGCLTNWNDKASSFISHTRAALYVDNSGKGVRYGVDASGPGSAGNLAGAWNDSISSVKICSSGSTIPC